MLHYRSERREANKKRFFEIKGEEKGYSGEFEFQRPEGKIVPIEFVSKVVEIRGKLFIQSITRDITERKMAEEALHKSEEDLKKRVKELEEFYQMAVGRELKMVELKKDIESLKEELSKYKKDDPNRNLT